MNRLAHNRVTALREAFDCGRSIRKAARECAIPKGTVENYFRVWKGDFQLVHAPTGDVRQIWEREAKRRNIGLHAFLGLAVEIIAKQNLFEAFQAEIDDAIGARRRERDHHISRALVELHRLVDSKFVDRLKAACELLRAALSKRKPVPTEPLAEVPASIFNGNDIYAAAAAVVPAHLSPPERQDIISDLVLAILEGDIQLDDLPKAVKEYSRRHWKMFGTIGKISLDAPLTSDSTTTRVEGLAGDMQDYWQ